MMWKILHGKYKYLAINTTLALLVILYFFDDITAILIPQKLVIYCRNMQFSPKNWDG